ncbi:hypothetical protein FRB95_012651 [Tulasnella sp. JGI-2019a]|nr:hypothetical protein FRB95_012651 [Tulasnella sp. JGI-2019a]
MGAATQTVTESCTPTSQVCPSSQKLEIRKANDSTRLDTEARNVHSPDNPLPGDVGGLVPVAPYKVISLCQTYRTALALLSLLYGAYLGAKLSSHSVAVATSETEVLMSMKLMTVGSAIATVDAAIGFVTAIALCVIARCIERQWYWHLWEQEEIREPLPQQDISENPLKAVKENVIQGRVGGL